MTGVWKRIQGRTMEVAQLRHRGTRRLPAHRRGNNEDKANTLSDRIATYYCRRAHFARLIAQQGQFTFASKPNLDHWQQIQAMIPDHCFQVRLKSETKLEILGRLSNLGVNAETLFPGPRRCWPVRRGLRKDMAFGRYSGADGTKIYEIKKTATIAAMMTSQGTKTQLEMDLVRRA
jgi:hypothetical protein